MSPRTWGWTLRRHVGGVDDGDVPTHVGVDHPNPPPHRRVWAMSPRTWGWTVPGGGVEEHGLGCPHARGGGPTITTPSPRPPAMSPRTWGWTRRFPDRFAVGRDVPTHVGVDRGCPGSWRRCWRCPHARGGGPDRVDGAVGEVVMSPRTWGWTRLGVPGRSDRRDVPTHVGVDRRHSRNLVDRHRCPHARGGGPAKHGQPAIHLEMSPRTWGWTASPTNPIVVGQDVPTHVGVDPRSTSQPPDGSGCPHARGGGPVVIGVWWDRTMMSPRTWGWTHGPARQGRQPDDVPTHVGVDRRRRCGRAARERCPHARGGGPSPSTNGPTETRMSPRTWGWTEVPLGNSGGPCDVPTHVGVDRRSRGCRGRRRRCPHARGGGPTGDSNTYANVEMSPRTWGWTPAAAASGPETIDVPTHVGVDRVPAHRFDGRCRCPHARGGGPR